MLPSVTMGFYPLEPCLRHNAKKNASLRSLKEAGEIINGTSPAPIMVVAVIRSAAKIESNSRPVVIWPGPVIASIRRISWSVIGLCLRRLIHVKINSRRNSIFAREQVTGSEHGRLSELIGVQRERLNDIFRRAKIVKRPIWIAKNLQRQRCGPYVLVIRFDADTRFGRFNGHIIGHGSIRSTFGPRRQRLASGQKTNCR